MKVTLEFDSNVDHEQVIHLAVCAGGVYLLIDHLLDQLAQWVDENPSDQQGKAFEKTRLWLCEEILNRGLYFSKSKEALPVDRSGDPLPRSTPTVGIEQNSKRE
jgi:hypothetical protein